MMVMHLHSAFHLVLVVQCIYNKTMYSYITADKLLTVTVFETDYSFVYFLPIAYLGCAK